MGGGTADDGAASNAAHRLSSQRTELIERLGDLPETRLSKPTPRHGWTLRHELAWLAAADEELLQRLALAAGSTSNEPHWRRVRGEAMHAAQEMRLAALRTHLEESGVRAAASLREHEARLEQPPIRDALESHDAHAAAALASLIAVLAK